jgi:ferritin-like metal-binding protein YciE
VRSFATTLGMQEAVALLDATLNEEKKADDKLTKLAESKVNQEASRTAAISR